MLILTLAMFTTCAIRRDEPMHLDTYSLRLPVQKQASAWMFVKPTTVGRRFSEVTVTSSAVFRGFCHASSDLHLALPVVTETTESAHPHTEALLGFKLLTAVTLRARSLLMFFLAIYIIIKIDY